MSIFSKDISVPVTKLYDECKDVCRIIIPGNMMHYRADKAFMQEDIIKELKHRNLFQERLPFSSDALNKISGVTVNVYDYRRGIPRFRVWFYYNSLVVTVAAGWKYLEQSYLTDFIVGISGVEGNGPLQ
jgi:hypothetical protein